MIELMRDRITIQKSSVKTDKIGNHAAVWEDVYSCAAYANNLSGKEYWAAAQVNAQTFAIIGLETRDYVIIGIGCIVVLIVSIIKEMGINVREALALKPLPVRWAVYYAFFAAIIILSYVTDNSGFMYAAF